MVKVLFVCTANKLRSPTAQAVFAEHPGLEARSAGLDAAAVQPLTEELVSWADRLFVMETRQRDIIRRRFPQGPRIKTRDRARHSRRVQLYAGGAGRLAQRARSAAAGLTAFACAFA